MIKVSACVIVKNEAANIERWLACVRQLATEIVVVDTGSDDATVEMAQAGGAEVVHFDWCDDFSAAKNFALDQVHGEWVIFLDADEYFSPDTIDLVLPAIARFHANRRVIGLVTRWINFDEDDHSRFINSGCQMRILRHQRTVRYRGKVHEAISNLSGEPERHMQLVPEIKIYHTGYTARLMPEKCRRNLQLLQEETAGRELHPLENVYFMDCYKGLEDYEKVLQYAERAIATGERFAGMETDADIGRITALVKLGRSSEQVLAAIDDAIGRFPQQAEFYFRKGFFCWDVKDYLGAEKALQQGLEHQELSAEKLAECLADNTQRYLPNVYLYLGKLKRMQRDLAAAMECFVKGLQQQPYNEELLQELLNCLSGQDPIESIQLLNALYDKEKDAAFLCRALAQRKPGKVYLYYARLAGLRGDAAVDYWAAGRPEAAAVQVGSELGGLYRLGIWAALRQGQAPSAPLNLLLPKEYQDAWQELGSGREAHNGIAQTVRQMMADAIRLPMVSIMIPTYNRPELFELTLRSALTQTYLNFEVIVCDNSTDDCTEKLMEKYEDDLRLRYIRNRTAKNKADNFRPFAQLARGELLQWCMDDDVLAKDKLAKMAACLQQHPEVMMVTSQRGLIDINGMPLPRRSAEMLSIHGEFGIFSGREIGRATLLTSNNFLGEPSAVLFRRRDLKHHYWQADCRGYKVISDVVMWLELLEKGDCAIFREPLSWFRCHAAQEGRQPDVVALSRIEWMHIVTESYERNVFLTTVEDYQAALRHLLEDYQCTGQYLLDAVSAGLRKEYQACMQKIQDVLQRE